MSRKVNKYLLTLPVDSWEDAQLLGSQTNWKILEILREVGSQGLSAEEVSKKADMPISTVYNFLSKLQAGKWVQNARPRRPQWGRPSKEPNQRRSGKPTTLFIASFVWEDIEFDEDFEDSLETVWGRLKEDTAKIKKMWLSVLEKIVSMYESDEQLKKFFPQDPIHEECGRSHEGEEFIYASSLALLKKIFESTDFNEFEKKYKFMK